MNKWVTRAAAVMLAASLALAGCSGKEAGLDNGNGTGGGADAEEDSITLKDVEGKDVVLSSKQEIPDSFPADIPMPDNVKVVSSISSSDQVTIAIETDMPFDKAVALYDEYVRKAGYAETHKLGEAGYYNYSGKKGNEQFVVTLQLDQEDNKTVFGALVYSKS